MLDIDFGTYPFVTSSNTISAAACIGLGIAPTRIKKVIGVSKAYCTRVGSGPFPTELNNSTGEDLRKAGAEFGATTGRPRRCGWLDIPALHYSILLSGVTEIIITKADVLNEFSEIKVATAYKIGSQPTGQVPFEISETEIEPVYHSIAGWQIPAVADSMKQMPPAVHEFVHLIESHTQTRITGISTGPHRDQVVWRT
jgi:adenylosuccinate synthase